MLCFAVLCGVVQCWNVACSVVWYCITSSCACLAPCVVLRRVVRCWGVAQCCAAVLYCIVLCCVVLYCLVLCRDVLYGVVL